MRRAEQCERDESLATLAAIPDSELDGLLAAWTARYVRAVLRGAASVGRVTLYRSHIVHVLNVWDYDEWARFEARDWLARELATEAHSTP